MAEINNPEEPTFPSKRKPDPATQELPNKGPKLAATLDHNETEETNPISNDNNNSEIHSTTNCSSEPDAVPKEEGENGNDDDDSERENDSDEDEDDDEDSDGETVVDRKGKGILRDDKGKGKLIEEDEDDDDDSDDDDGSDDDGNVSGSDSDFSDDPLAEVDLNNILPSRTRRRTSQPGVHIAGDTGNADDDSDDSDA